ncbi:non-ribosomal peptide synthetase [Oceanirhabdus sp. W0125-5]|uniref:non-ribosomal peptide synthetase n=1 Tax=Oceanirhabdus sp. W0125-5 TaxID=2999116 RepID=UPI0022F31244|nr:non-ribosomal peptide synthetase [Oceanirhabdus sp. W0125-5]WBW99495.1 amino acid adenylation domain-containing protein [Oceanirhabdus sp. W0125-5]
MVKKAKMSKHLEVYKEAYNYWSKKINNIHSDTNIPKDGIKDFESKRGIYSKKINSNIVKKIHEICNNNDLSVYIFLVSSLDILLYKFTGETNIVIGSPLYQDIEDNTGRENNANVILSDTVNANSTFKQFLLEVKDTIVKAYKYQYYPLNEVSKEFNVSMNIVNNPNIVIMHNKIHNINNNYSNDIVIKYLENELSFCVEYNASNYTQNTIDTLINCYINIVEQCVFNLIINIKDIEIINEIEKKMLIDKFYSSVEMNDVESTIDELFEVQTKRTPENIAVVFGNKHLTYRELNERSNQVARILVEKGIESEKIVGILVEQSIEMIVGIMGILKAGGAYLPIDPNYPDERINYIIKDSKVNVILTDDEENKFSNLSDIITVNLLNKDILNIENSNLNIKNKPSDMAYIIYTSGSTGRPKGVVVEHRNVVSLMENNKYLFDFTSDDIWTMFHSFCFDFSVWEMYGALLNGGKLIVVPKAIAQDTQEYLKLLKKEEVTVLNQTPTAFYNLLEEEMKFENRELKIRYVIFGGEALKPLKLKQWKEKYSDIKLINMYGITETTVHVTYKEITSKEIENNISNIGSPIKTLVGYVMNEELKLCPIGVVGELCVGGLGVARGYLNREDLTNVKFVRNPYKPDERLYRSGDLVKMLESGDMVYVGRADHQVKIRGHRIEVGEIETILLKYEEIKEVVVIVKENMSQSKYLCAYIVTDKDIKSTELRNYMRLHLPEYMVPSFFIKLQNIPITANGKVNIKKLPDPEGHIETGVQYEAPRNIEEKEMVNVWEQVLGVKKVGINDDFFTLGGDSIKAIQIASQVNKLNKTIAIKEILQKTTIKELTPFVKDKEEASDSEEKIVGHIELTPIQHWFFKQNYEAINHFNQSVMLTSKNGFDEEKVRQVFDKIIEHHDILRTVFLKNGEIYKGYNRDISDKIYKINIIYLHDEVDKKERIGLEVNKVQASLDIENGPLINICIFKGEDQDELLIVMHHLIIDGVSWRIILEDFNMGYQQSIKQKKIEFQTKTTSYKKWAHKLIEYTQKLDLSNEKKYCQSLKSKHKEIRTDKKVIQRKQEKAEVVSVKIDKEKTAQVLTKVHETYNTEINDLLLTALGMTIGAFNGTKNIVIDVEGHGRGEIIEGVDITRTVGWFTTIYPVLIQVEKSKPLSYNLKKNKENIRKIKNKEINYNIFKYMTSNDNQLTQESDIIFNYLGQFDSDINTETFNLSDYSSGQNIGNKNQISYKLEVNAVVIEQELNIHIKYNNNEYEVETIKKIAANYKNDLEKLIIYCMSADREKTPSDYGKTEITLDEFEEINGYLMQQSKEEIQAMYNLSPMQQGMLFHKIQNEESTMYFEQISFEIEGKVDIRIMQNSFNELIKRHDILRTIFIYENVQKPIQIVLKERQNIIHYKDICSLDNREKMEYIKKIKYTDRKNGFDLRKDNLFRLFILKIEEKKHIMIWSHHHIIMDGWCVGIIIDEFLVIYNKLINNKKITLNNPIQYNKYLEWLDKQNYKEGLEYWKEILEGYNEQITLPKKTIENEPLEYEIGEESLIIDSKITNKLLDIVKENKVTLNTVFQGIWAIMLQKYNNTNDVVFGVIVSGRPSELEGIEKMIGLFINNVPVRVKTTKEMNFRDLLLELQQQQIDAQKNSYCLLSDIQSNTDLKGKLIDNILVFENYPLTKLQDKGEINIDKNSLDVFEQSNYNFSIIVTPGDEVKINFKYNKKVYDLDIVKNIAQNMKSLFERLDVNVKLKDIEILCTAEKNKIINNFNNTRLDFNKEKTISELFEEQLENNSDKIAIVCEERKITYEELNNKANQLAKLLREEGVRPDTIVGVLAERSIEMIVAILAILKAGGAYLPIDIEYPEERINYMLSDSNVEIILTNTQINVQTIGDNKKIINLNDVTILNKDVQYIENVNNIHDLAYVIYTSGTTGNPKGVMIEHLGINNLKCWFEEGLSIGNNERILQFASISFDAFGFEMYMALLLGNTLFIPNKDVVTSYELLNKYIINNGITTVTLPPFVAANLNQECGLNRLITAGSELKGHAITNLHGKFDIINAYGPTEDTICTTYFIVQDYVDYKVPIGKPIYNHKVLILDSDNNLVPIGGVGELCISGMGLARGYKNKSQLTDEKFIDNPFELDEKIYKTGDLGRWLPDGNIEFLGRVDQQVKIRGFRIEVGEIEARLVSHVDIKEAVVLVKEDKNNSKFLCAYIVTKVELTIGQIRNYLSKTLPDYMIPSYCIQIDSIPLTSNGKVNTSAFPEPGDTIDTGVEYAAPQNDIEEKMVEVWQDVLGLKRVGVNDNFFELGGDSIKAIQVSSRLNKYKIKLEISDLMNKSTIRELSSVVKINIKSDAYQGTVIGEVKLTPIQKWFFNQRFNNMNHWNQAIMLYREDGFEEYKITNVFKEIVSHHDALRMIYKFDDYMVKQFNRGDEEGELFSIETIDLTSEPNYKQKITKEASRIQSSINLEEGPLVKLGLMKTVEGDHLLIVIHHLVVDGVSWRIILEDFRQAYEMVLNGEKIIFNEKTESFQEWSNKINNYSKDTKVLNEEDYWKSIYEEQVEEIRVDYMVKNGKVRDSDKVTTHISKEKTDKLLKQANSAFNTEINDLLLTSLGIALNQWSGYKSVMVNMESHGRRGGVEGTDISRTVGWFTSTYPIILQGCDRGDISKSIKQVKENIRRIPNLGIGHDVLKYLSDKNDINNLMHTKKAEINFNYLGQFDQDFQNEIFCMSEISVGDSISRESELIYALDVNTVVVNNRLRVDITYNKNEFKEESIKIFADELKNSIYKVIDYCLSKDEVEYTPSDYGNINIDLEDFNEIMDTVDELLEVDYE